MEVKLRLLRAEEIECRIGIINEKGVSLLLFKDARVDQKILDEVFTPFGWKRSHQVLDGNLYCTVEIWDGEKQQWVAKQDVGTMSYSEKEKGQASDSFKRACFNWGIGRELYTAPFIWIPAELAKLKRKGEKLYSQERFHVREINYNQERAICLLTIANELGQVVYQWKRRERAAEEPGKRGMLTKGGADASRLSGLNGGQLSALEQELQRTGVSLDCVLSRYGISAVEQMTEAIYTDAMKGLRKSKNRRIA